LRKGQSEPVETSAVEVELPASTRLHGHPIATTKLLTEGDADGSGSAATHATGCGRRYLPARLARYPAWSKMQNAGLGRRRPLPRRTVSGKP